VENATTASLVCHGRKIIEEEGAEGSLGREEGRARAGIGEAPGREGSSS